MIVKTVIAVLEIKDVFFYFSFSSSLSIRSCVIFCHIDHIISAILSSRNRKPGAEKISKFYLLSDTKKSDTGEDVLPVQCPIFSLFCLFCRPDFTVADDNLFFFHQMADRALKCCFAEAEFSLNHFR